MCAGLPGRVPRARGAHEQITKGVAAARQTEGQAQRGHYDGRASACNGKLGVGGGVEKRGIQPRKDGVGRGHDREAQERAHHEGRR